MTLHRHVIAGLCALLFPAAVYSADALPDPDISVNPVVLQFPVTALGGRSNPASVTITNHSAAAIPMGAMTLAGVNPAEFTIGSSTCGATLASTASCSVEVSFSPASKGTKSAALQIPYGSGTMLTAFLTNTTSAIVEAQLRVPPVLSAVAIPDSLVPGNSYTLTWTLEGYDNDNTTNAVLFDCTGISDGSCGNSYTDSSRFAESTLIAPVSTVSPGNWSYSGVRTKLFNYSWNFTVPATRAGGAAWATSPGTEIVVRFYQRSDTDEARNSASVSLLIPGNQANNYYDTNGRRIVKWVVAP